MKVCIKTVLTRIHTNVVDEADAFPLSLADFGLDSFNRFTLLILTPKFSFIYILLHQ